MFCPMLCSSFMVSLKNESLSLYTNRLKMSNTQGIWEELQFLSLEVHLSSLSFCFCLSLTQIFIPMPSLIYWEGSNRFIFLTTGKSIVIMRNHIFLFKRLLYRAHSILATYMFQSDHFRPFFCKACYRFQTFVFHNSIYSLDANVRV